MRPLTQVLCLATCCLAPLWQTPAHAATIWSGPRRTFTKANYADWTQLGNQDRITSLAWITRKDSSGPFNIAQESAYGTTSPANTEWAYGSTSNLPAVYKTWVNWHGGNPASSIGSNAVIHLIAEDIYLDIKFTAFTGSNGGGGFSYERAGYVALTLKGPAQTSVSRFGVFTDPGATASNSAGAPLTVSATGSVDTSTPGDYALSYSATDSLGFVASANRLVSVLETNSAPSWWLAQYNLDTNSAGSLLDSDEDGMTNWVEYLAGTDPTNKQSMLWVSAVSDGMALEWPSVTGRVYSVYQTTNLTLPFGLVPGGSNLTAAPPRNAYTNSEVPPPRVQFFRIGVQLAE